MTPKPLFAKAAARLALAGLAVLFTMSASLPAAAQDLASFEEKTTVHVLDNGWTFILVERPVAPVFSFMTSVGVGGAQEVPGITGLAHMFEHMAFKGTPVIGTSDYEAEKEALVELEASYQAWQDERLRLEPDEEALAKLRADFEAKQEAARQYVVSNEFGDIIDGAGGVGVNAFTSSDRTGYFYSLPANRFELFTYLESERFLNPVFREFYTERDVVQEERRLRTDSQPIGRLVEQFISAAFLAHPYGQPVVGYMSDLESITITDAKAFFDTYYAPSNMITAVVGDIDPKTAIPLIDKYFGRIPARKPAPRLRTVEPPQIAEKVVTLVDAAQPFYIEGYHKPANTHPDQEIYSAISDILSNGRTSRLYRSMVRDQKIAVAVQSFTFPGPKYPNLLTVLAVPAPGFDNDDVSAAIHAELDRLKSEDVTDEELERFKTRAKANLIRGLGDNNGLATQMATYQSLYGDWRELFRHIERIDAVTKADIRRVANETIRATNRTVAMIVNEDAAADADSAGGPSS